MSAKTEVDYEDYKCPDCGSDRCLEVDTMICQHCGNSEKVL